MISTDRTILEIGTFARARMEKYAEALGELHIIVLGTEKEVQAPQSGSLWVYTTRSLSPILYGVDAFIRALRIGTPDVITVQDPFETGLLGVLLSWWFRVPLHVQVHTDFLAPAFKKHSTLNRIRVSLAGFVLRSAKRIRVVASRIKKGIETRYHPRAPVTVLPIYVDVNRFASIAPVAHEYFKTTLLVVSRLETEKQVPFAIHALVGVRAEGIDAGLIIVGEGRERSNLKMLAEQLGVSEYVQFLGRQDPLPLYAQADLVLVPSEYEGYGLVIIEALAAGIPVVSTDVGVAKESGAIIAPSEKEGFVKTVVDLFKKGKLPVGVLSGHPYESEEEYIATWGKDVTDSRTAV